MRTVDVASDKFDRFARDVCHQLSGGHTVVADRFFDPVQRKECCLIEYIPPSLAASHSARQALQELATMKFSDCDRLIVRLPGADDRIAGFREYLYYIRLDTGPRTTRRNNGIDVRPASVGDRDRLIGWLTTAFDDALAAQSQHGAPGASARQALDVLSDPDCVSFIASCGGTDIGHVTLLENRYDPLTDRSYIELLDVLVQPTHPRRRSAEAALVRTAAEHAAAQYETVIGHIVCGSPQGGASKSGEKIMAALEGEGWVFDHKFQVLDIDGSFAATPLKSEV